MGPGTNVAIAISPLLASTRKHAIPMYLPGVDVLKSPIYEIVYVFVVISLIFGIIVYNSHCNMITSINVFGLAQIEVLGYKLQHLETDFLKESNSKGKLIPQSEVIKRNFISCIDMHREIIR